MPAGNTEAKRKKRIAFFHEVDVGGARRAANEFSKNIPKHYEVDLYVVDSKKIEEEEKYYHSVKFYKFNPKTWNGNNWKAKLYKDTVELVKLYYLHKKVANVINTGEYDLVFVMPSKYTQAPFILRHLKKPIVYYCQEPLRMVYEDLFKVGKEVGLGRYYYEKINRIIRKNIDKSNIRKAKTIIANSKYTKRNIYSAYGLKSKHLYMGVDVDFFKPDKSKKQFDILYVGSYDKADNYALLEKALKSINFDFKKGRFLFREKEWISKNTEMRKIYRSSKILVCLGYKEPFGLLPIEAMSCGLPVIALDEGGYKESIKSEKTGYLVKNDVVQLADAIKKILAHNTYVGMGNSARKNVVSEWTWKVSAKKLSNVFEGVIVK